MHIHAYSEVTVNCETANIIIEALAAELTEPAEYGALMLTRARHHLKPKEDDNFGVVEPTALMELWLTLTGTLANGSIGVVFVFLIIGGIVIMNIMLASVTERTREIGVRKSLGATRRDVLLQFMVESSVMAAVGGIIGVVVASAIGYAMGRFTPLPTSVPIRWVVLAVGISTLVGLFFGVYPAYKASKLNPIEALRFET